MGSPNFYTGDEILLNLGLELESFLSPDADLSELDDCLEELLHRDIKQACIEMESCVGDLPTLFFHDITLVSGHHSGFQVYITGNYGKDKQKYIERSLKEWNQYKSFTSTDGYEHDLDECPYFRDDIKNLTPFSLERAMKKELKEIHNSILKKAKELNMGEIVGRSWTSSTVYPIPTKPIR